MGVVALILLFFSNAYAVEPTWIQEAGKPWGFSLPDGRVAELRIGRRPLFDTNLDLEVTETTCTGKAGAKGKFHFWLQLNNFGSFWVKHPTAAKVGKLVSIKYGQGDFAELIDVSFVTGFDRQKFAKAAATFPADSLETSDFLWLPEAVQKSPTNLEFVRWDVEFMQTSPETGISENRTATVAAGVKLLKNADGKFEIKEMKHKFGSGVEFFVGDVWSFILKNREDYCQVSTKQNLGKLVTEVGKYFGMSPNYQTYTYGTDEYSDFKNNLTLSLKAFYDNSKSAELD